MSDQDIGSALMFGAAGGLSLQQLPYHCPDPSFEYTTESDILKPAVGMVASGILKIKLDELTETEDPLEQSSKTASKNEQGDQVGRPNPDPKRDDVQPSTHEPDSVEKPKSELEALLEFQDIQDPYPYPGNIDVLPSYSSEPPDSADSINLRAQAKHALANAWKYDPIRCSVKSSFHAARDLASRPKQGLTKLEYDWAILGKFTTVKKPRSPKRVDFKKARIHYEWMKNLDPNGEIVTCDGTNLDKELDEFYGADGTDLRPIENDFDDEGFSEPGAINTTLVAVPDKSLLEPGVTPGGIFQDSGISMDEGYARYALAQSLPNTSKDFSGTVPSDWPTFSADIAPLQTPKKTGPWLGLVGDQKQCDWPGRRQGPYDLLGIRSWVRASRSDHVEILDEPGASISDPQGVPGSFAPQPVPREPSLECDVEASVGKYVEATGARITAASAVAEVRDADKMVDAPIVGTTRKTPLPAETTSSSESVEHAQEVSELMEGIVDEKPSEVTPRLLAQEQPHTGHDNNSIGKNIEPQEQLHDIPTSSKETENSKSSEVVPQLASEEGRQHLDNSSESGLNNGPSSIAPCVNRAILQSEIDASAHAPRNTPTTALTTPVNQRIRRIQQVQVDTPVTPATIDINLTPQYDRDMDADDASDGSLEVHLPNSPTANTQKGQSALSRYVQVKNSHPNNGLQNSSTVSLDGSESEEVSLVPTPEHPSQPEGHAGFSKGVELHQRNSDAVFTLGTPKASQETPSPSKTAAIPSTPVNENASASFRPITPFQLGSPAHPDFDDSPGTPTPAPKASKANAKTVKSIFSSPKLGSRSPERAAPSSEIVVAPFAPAAGAGDLQRGAQGLLFQKAKANERDTKNVLNSLQLSPERGNGSAVRESLNDYEDELAGEKSAEVYKGGNSVQGRRGTKGSGIDLGANGGRKVAQAVVVPSVRSRDESEGMQGEDVQTGEPRKKKPRKSVRAQGGADVSDVRPFSDH